MPSVFLKKKKKKGSTHISILSFQFKLWEQPDANKPNQVRPPNTREDLDTLQQSLFKTAQIHQNNGLWLKDGFEFSREVISLEPGHKVRRGPAGAPLSFDGWSRVKSCSRL